MTGGPRAAYGARAETLIQKGKKFLFTYRIVESYDPLLGRTSYGILAREEEDGAIREMAFVPRISGDRAFVQQILERCEKNQLSPLHLLDVVTDTLP